MTDYPRDLRGYGAHPPAAKLAAAHGPGRQLAGWLLPPAGARCPPAQHAPHDRRAPMPPTVCNRLPFFLWAESPGTGAASRRPALFLADALSRFCASSG